ncbi:MAG: AAA family ATPase [Parachlamydiaceae bacterium]|nr:AAA family ATPase [Parachlamydiaceae bacterium]
MKKQLPIGISDFKELIEDGYVYVDKTLFIQELIEIDAKVVLIPRFRRFGKTLNLSMLRYFFEKSKEDASFLFYDLKIWENEAYRMLAGQFPVIFFSLKDVKHLSWHEAFKSLRRLIADEFDRHSYLKEGETLSIKEKELFHKILFEENDQSLIERSLFYLTSWLHRFHNKRVILLIDEYDTPAHASYVNGYYDILIPFIRNWLSAGLKDNSSLERGVLTGILRIAKESIFSGLNNIATCTVMHERFKDKFGLLESEVTELLKMSGLEHLGPEIQKWYNGYRVGSCTGIYNPWSVLQCIAENGALGSYWVNTSDNALMKQLIIQGGEDLKADLEELLRGNAIEKNIEEGIVFPDLEKSPNAVWSLLLFSGYLTLDAPPSYDKPSLLRIPNLEVNNLYHSMISNWFEKTIHMSNYHLLLNSLINGDIATFSQIFQEFLLSSVSVFDLSFDEPEKLYHAFILGMLIGLKDRYEVQSNRESGYGRYDVMLIPKNQDDLGIIMEFKKVGRFENADLETAVLSALKQIEDKHYTQGLLNRGIKRILHLGLAFEGKKVLIRSKFND